MTTKTHQISDSSPLAQSLADGDTLEFSGDALVAYRNLHPSALEGCTSVDTDSCAGDRTDLQYVIGRVREEMSLRED